MAFIFVPNAEGGFDEGDRQTNPDTGVEYIYISGAWRALGPDISNEFPELDERYVNKAGDTMTGNLMVGNSRNLIFKKADGSNQFSINPNVNSDYFTNIYTFNSLDGNGGVRFRVSQDQGVAPSSYDTLVSLSGIKQDIGGVEYTGTLALNRVQTPTDPDQAANKWYVDNAVGNVDLSEYLPLAGGTMTGDLDMNNANIEMLGSRIDFFNDAGDKTMEIAKSGFIKSRDMLRVVREDGGPILEGRTSESSSDIKVKIDSDGYFQFRDRGELYGDIYLKGNKRYIVQGAANTNVAQFFARTDNIARFEPSVSGKTIEIKGVADPVDPRDAVNLQYLNGLPFATEDYVNTATEHDLTDEGTQNLEPDNWVVKQKNQDGNNRTFIGIYDGEMHLYNVADPTNGADGWAVNKGYVDTLFSSSGGGSYLPLTGGDLTGKIDITIDSPGNAAIRTIGSINVKGDGQGIGGSNNFIAHKDYVRVYSTPSSPQDVVNKEYAEGHFAATGHTHDYKKAALWKAVSPSTAAGDLQVGEFFVADNNNIYLNPKSANGIDLGISGTTEYSQSMTYLASIYGRGTYNSLYSTVADKINFNVSSNNYIRVQSSHLLYKQGFSVGTQYVINIPGFTP